VSERSRITPGPWSFCPYKGMSFYIQQDYSPGKRIAEIHYTDGAHSFHEADARLIAAAPDLLAALNMIRHQWAGHAEECAYVTSRYKQRCNCDWTKVAAQCDAAIAKATGAA
jgi:hypothetical protein